MRRDISSHLSKRMFRSSWTGVARGNLPRRTGTMLIVFTHTTERKTGFTVSKPRNSKCCRGNGFHPAQYRSSRFGHL